MLLRAFVDNFIGESIIDYKKISGITFIPLDLFFMDTK